MIAAAEQLIESGARNFGLLFVVGEERNSVGAEIAARSPRGSRYLINGELDRRQSCSWLERNLRYEIVARRAEWRIRRWRYPELGESAIEKLLDALDAVRRMPLPEDPVLGKTTVNIGTISGGRAPNIIPDAAKAELAIRIVGDAREIDQALRNAIGDRAEVTEILTLPAMRFCANRWFANLRGSVYHRYPGARARLGGTFPFRARQHSRGAHNG